MRGVLFLLSIPNLRKFKQWNFLLGLDDNLLPYIHNIVECGINGHRLLSATVEDLQCFQIDKLGHQEIFMSAVDLLREFVC